VLFRLGELIAQCEGAEAMARRGAQAATADLHPKADHRFDAAGMAIIGRIAARNAALAVVTDGVRWVIGAAATGAIDAAELDAAVGANDIRNAQAGLIDDMDRLADEIYERTAT
jgi:hypothetical protein